MRFDEAILVITKKRDAKVKRKDWEGEYVFYTESVLVAMVETVQGYIAVIYEPSTEDIYADDWIEYDKNT